MKKVIDQINKQTIAINELSERIKTKVSRSDLILLLEELKGQIEEWKSQNVEFTKGLVTFFTDTIIKNSEANGKLLDSVLKLNNAIDEAVLKIKYTVDEIKDKKESLKQNNSEETEWL